MNLDKGLANAKEGVYTFRIHGVVHRFIGQLMPREGEAPAFTQIYIHYGTPEAELENRLLHLDEASLPELRGIQLMLHQYNPYVSFFRQEVDLMREQGGADLRMVIRTEGAPDSRRYNAPTQGRIKEGWGPGASCECEAPFSSLGLLLIEIKIFSVICPTES